MIPANYTQSLLQGKSAEIQWIEMRVSESSYILRAAAEGVADGLKQSAAAVQTSAAISPANANAESQEDKLEQLLQEIGRHRLSGEALSLQLYPKPGLNNVTGFTIMFMMGLLTSAVAVIMDDRKQRTMARMYTAPVRSYEIALGNFLGSLAIELSRLR